MRRVVKITEQVVEVLERAEAYVTNRRVHGKHGVDWSQCGHWRNGH